MGNTFCNPAFFLSNLSILAEMLRCLEAERLELPQCFAGQLLRESGWRSLHPVVALQVPGGLFRRIVWVRHEQRADYRWSHHRYCCHRGEVSVVLDSSCLRRTVYVAAGWSFVCAMFGQLNQEQLSQAHVRLSFHCVMFVLFVKVRF